MILPYFHLSGRLARQECKGLLKLERSVCKCGITGSVSKREGRDHHQDSGARRLGLPCRGLGGRCSIHRLLRRKGGGRQGSRQGSRGHREICQQVWSICFRGPNTVVCYGLCWAMKFSLQNFMRSILHRMVEGLHEVQISKVPAVGVTEVLP